MKNSLSQRLGAILFGAGLLLACPFAAGCGDGSDRVDVSGTATFNGQPIPSGRIYFTPDPRTNTGPQGYADIKDGQFDTKKTGKGTSSGATLVRIEGFAGTTGDDLTARQPLFVPHEMSATLPAKATPQTFDVPVTAAKNLPKTAGPLP